MSTRSAIICQTAAGFSGIYCHSDGYPAGVGFLLQRDFNTPEKAAALVALGDLSTINRDGTVYAYHRDRGDQWEDVSPIEVASLADIIPMIDNDDQVYVFADGAWTHNKKPLVEVLARPEIKARIDSLHPPVTPPPVPDLSERDAAFSGPRICTGNRLLPFSRPAKLPVKTLDHIFLPVTAAQDPAAVFAEEIKTNGVAYSNGIRYAIKQGDDEMFSVEITRDGKRESGTDFFAEIEGAQKLAIALQSPPAPVKQASMKDRIAAGLAALTALQPFIGHRQSKFVASLIRTSEEKEFFIDKMIELAAHVETMPHTYQQDGLGEQAIAHLHYFTGGCDWWITEKDMGDKEDPSPNLQHQAFGYACLGDPTFAELGYVSLPEILNAGAELDFHWKPTALAEIKAKLAA